MLKRRSTTVIALICATSILTGCAAAVAGAAIAGVAVAHDRRSTGTIIDDNAMELKISSAIKGDQALFEAAHVSVVSYNGNVVLVGQAPSDELRARAEQIAYRAANVNKVFNEIKLSAPNSQLARSNDAWITTKVKTKMVFDANVDPTRTKIVTEDGVVYLMGLVTPKEELSAVDIARQTSGVKKVVKIFEYLHDEPPKRPDA